MHSVASPVLQARAHHRHDIRALAYVVLDEGNGGIVRNLSHQGMAVQAVAALRTNQTVRVRFELRNPRLRVEARGQVVWANSTGRCGIRFLDLPPRMIRQVNEWIFGDILEGIPQDSGYLGPIFGKIEAPIEDDGLLLSPAPCEVIQLEPRIAPAQLSDDLASLDEEAVASTDWLSRPLSQRSLAWIIDSLVMVAGFLLFALVFLSFAHELPRWPLSLEIGLGIAIFVPAFYCGFFYAFGRASLGSRLAKLAVPDEEEMAEDDLRFR